MVRFLIFGSLSVSTIMYSGDTRAGRDALLQNKPLEYKEGGAKLKPVIEDCLKNTPYQQDIKYKKTTSKELPSSSVGKSKL